MDYQERRRLQADRTEQAILQAAVELFRAGGYDKVSVRDICKAAGITTGAFYHHFRSKEDLITRGFSPMDDYISQALAGSEDAPIPEQLRILLVAYASFIESQGWETVSRYYQRRLSDPDADLSMDPNRFTLGAMEECLRAAEAQGLLTKEVSAEWTADFFFRHFRGVAIDWALHRGSYSLRAKLEQDYALFERAFHA